KDELRKHSGVEVTLPTRGSKGSAGYDFCSPIGFKLQVGETIMLWTDVKAKMLSDEVLMLHIRSSVGSKGVVLTNGVGVIDSTYYGNISNDGNIGMKLKNNGSEEFSIEEGDRIAQGVFNKFLVIDGDLDDDLLERVGGYGSTNRK
ncbi:MAG: hypothetical protein ACRC0F_12060, partial [Cetobacterium sp.]